MQMKRWTQINNFPIRYKLIFHFLLISILPIFCLALLVSWTVERVMEEQVNDNTIQLIDKVNETFEFYISNLQNYTYMIANNDEVQQFLETSEIDLLSYRIINMKSNDSYVTLLLYHQRLRGLWLLIIKEII